MADITERVLGSLSEPNHKEAKARGRRTLFPVAALCLVLSGAYLKEHFFDASDFITAQKLIAPIGCRKQAADLDSTKQTVTGKCVDLPDVGDTIAKLPIVNEFHPGDTFGWVSTLCVERGVTVRAALRFIHLLPDGSEKEIGNRVVNTPFDRCGPAVGSQLIPANAQPGTYEVRRTIIIRPGSLFQFSDELEPVIIQVVAKE